MSQQLLSEILMPAVEWNHDTWGAGHFYSRRNPTGDVFYGGGRAHSGHDAKAPNKSKAVAPLRMEIVLAGWQNNGIGWAVIGKVEDVLVDIEDVGDGVSVGDVITIYIRLGHLYPRYKWRGNKLRCKVGDIVEQGQVVALVGTSGASSGPHIHWSITVGRPEWISWKQEKHLDPELCATGSSPRYYYVTHPKPPKLVPIQVEGLRFELRRGHIFPLVRSEVRELQGLLVAKGFLPNASEIDGAFGPRTESAVIKFQRANDLTADGLVGQATWEAILS